MKEIPSRFTIYNELTSKEKLAQVDPENLALEEAFIEYLVSTGKAKGTIRQYRANLHVFWCWNLEYNLNRSFTRIIRKHYVQFQRHALKKWGWSPRRLKAVKSTIYSLSRFIQKHMKDVYPRYKPIIQKLSVPADRAVREKSVFDEKKDIEPLLKKLVEDGDYDKACALALAVNSGRRKSELLCFKVGYFRPECTICDGVLYKTPEPVKNPRHGNKGDGICMYTIAPPFDPYLKLWLRERKRLKIRSQWLFPRRFHGKWLDEPAPVAMLDAWAKQFTQILGKPFYWHAMRHFFTTKLINYGIPSDVISDLIGWENTDMVRLYDDTNVSAFEKYFGNYGIRKPAEETTNVEDESDVDETEIEDMDADTEEIEDPQT